LHLTQEKEEEGIGDVDLFTLVDSGERLAVNAKWLGHLAERQLGEDGHPRKVQFSNPVITGKPQLYNPMKCRNTKRPWP